MTDITRFDVTPRMSQAVIYRDTVYLAGQCGTAFDPVEQQTRDALAKVDYQLSQAGTDKKRLLCTTIWLSRISDYDAVNQIWDDWIPPGTAPARACGEVKIGGDGYFIEIICMAALR